MYLWAVMKLYKGGVSPKALTVSHVFEGGLGTGAVFESNGVTDFCPEDDVHFLRDAGGD